MMTLIHPIPEVIPATLLTLSLEIATHAHRNHPPRKISGKPYITHPMAVAEGLEERLKPLGYLHDVMEDHPDEYPESRMRELLPPWVVDHLLLLTRGENEPYDVFILRAATTEATRLVKIEDITHNLRDLARGSLFDKYRLALRILGVNPDTRHRKTEKASPLPGDPHGDVLFKHHGVGEADAEWMESNMQ